MKYYAQFNFSNNTPSHFCACLKQGPGFPTLHVVIFFCVQLVQLRREAIVRFVDIGGIADHQCIFSLYSMLTIPAKLRSIATI